MVARRTPFILRKAFTLRPTRPSRVCGVNWPLKIMRTVSNVFLIRKIVPQVPISWKEKSSDWMRWPPRQKKPGDSITMHPLRDCKCLTVIHCAFAWTRPITISCMSLPTPAWVQLRARSSKLMASKAACTRLAPALTCCSSMSRAAKSYWRQIRITEDLSGISSRQGSRGIRK